MKLLSLTEITTPGRIFSSNRFFPADYFFPAGLDGNMLVNYVPLITKASTEKSLEEPPRLQNLLFPAGKNSARIRNICGRFFLPISARDFLSQFLWEPTKCDKLFPEIFTHTHSMQPHTHSHAAKYPFFQVF